MTDISDIEAKARAATPGPWFQAYARVVSGPLNTEYQRIERTWGDDDMADDDPRWKDLPDPDVCHFTAAHGDTLSGQHAADAVYVAAASPDVILGLIERVRRLEAAAIEARATLHYDLADLAPVEHELTGAAARLWRANMAAWKMLTESTK